jgi:hypothetical protein
MFDYFLRAPGEITAFLYTRIYMRLYNFIFFEPGGVVYYNFFVDAYSYYYETIWAIDDLTFG